MNKKYRKPIIAGNWKMNMLASQTKDFADELKPLLPKTRGCESVVCAPYPLIPSLVKAVKGMRVAVGAQDVSVHDKGAYTGEVSAAMLKDLGAHSCIVRHSQRRAYHGAPDHPHHLCGRDPGPTGKGHYHGVDRHAGERCPERSDRCGGPPLRHCL